MDINRLYILLVLGVSAKVDAAVAYTYKTQSQYAGDCLTPDSFNKEFGYSEFDCQDKCYKTFQNWIQSRPSEYDHEDDSIHQGDFTDDSSITDDYYYGDYSYGDYSYGDYSYGDNSYDDSSNSDEFTYGAYSGDGFYGDCAYEDYSCQVAFITCGQRYSGQSTQIQSCHTAVNQCSLDYPSFISDEVNCLVSASYQRNDQTCRQLIQFATYEDVVNLVNRRKYKLKQNTVQTVETKYPFKSGVTLVGKNKLGTKKISTYCDHDHLYSFVITSITPSAINSKNDLPENLEMFGYSMNGFPDSCVYTDWVAIQSPIVENIEMATSGDQFALTCGYYAQYDWSGFDPVYFEIHSNESVGLLGMFGAILISLLIFI